MVTLTNASSFFFFVFFLTNFLCFFTLHFYRFIMQTFDTGSIDEYFMTERIVFFFQHIRDTLKSQLPLDAVAFDNVSTTSLHNFNIGKVNESMRQKCRFFRTLNSLSEIDPFDRIHVKLISRQSQISIIFFIVNKVYFIELSKSEVKIIFAGKDFTVVIFHTKSNQLYGKIL